MRMVNIYVISYLNIEMKKMNDFEPYIGKDVAFYLAEVEVYSKQNVTYNLPNVYLNHVKCISLVPLRNDEDIRNAKESIYRHYEKDIK